MYNYSNLNPSYILKSADEGRYKVEQLCLSQPELKAQVSFSDRLLFVCLYMYY